MTCQSQNLARPRALVVEQAAPQVLRPIGRGRWFFDFGRAAFGTVRLTVHADRQAPAELCLGEKLDPDGMLDRQPPGCIRCRCLSLDLRAGTGTFQVEIPPDTRNTGPAAVRMPPELFEAMPFRYGELTITGDADAELREVTRLAVSYPFDETASAFQCDDEGLNRVWDLCRYSIKATSFCGIYVDGDRERIPYEGDAYINQLCHYGVDAEYEMARHSLEYLLFHPTWPTEWSLHCLPMAWADYQYTGRTDLLAAYYDVLRRKALLPLARADGLISTEAGLVTPELLADVFMDHPQGLTDLIDWPPASFTDGGRGERDNYDMVPVKTVVNAFHAWNVELLAAIAGILERAEDAAAFRDRHARVVESLQRVCFRSGSGIFADGEGSQHSSLHANMIPAALGLIPAGSEANVLAFIKSRGMACSVYGAQYLLEACYRLGAADYALDLMTAEHDRGWLNMLRSGSTVSLEAWDYRYKNNLDWNHAWGAAPANIIPRFVAGVRPATPGFGTVLVAPQPGNLRQVSATVPTARGPVQIQIEQAPGSRRLCVETPAVTALDVSGLLTPGARVKINGRDVALDAGQPPTPLPAGRIECDLNVGPRNR